jgi:hypothetical protein
VSCRRALIFFFCSLWILVGAALTNAAPPPQQVDSGIEVSISANSWTVQILKPSHLRAVLESVCKQSQTVCDITPDLSDDVIAPMVLRGDPSTVVSQLLEGMKVNYSYAPSTPQEKGKLIVEALPPGAFDHQMNASQPPAPETQPDIQGVTTVGMNPTPEETSTPSSASMADSAGAAASDQTSELSSSQAFPFPGSDGHVHAVSMNREASPFLPIFDSTGKLVPNPNTGVETPSTVSPSIGPDGKLITMPVGSGKWQFLPALDSRGNLLPAP